jgi:diacylglycerol kinase (ATP)
MWAAVSYLVTALVFIVLGLTVNSIYFAVAFFWTALSLLLVSGAYFFNAGKVFRKRENGVIPFYIRWAFVPFLLGAQIYNAWSRKRDKVPPIQQINDNLFLACRLFPSDIDTLK